MKNKEELLKKRREYWAKNKDKINKERRERICKNQDKHNNLRREKYKELKIRKEKGDIDSYFVKRAELRFKDRIRGLLKISKDLKCCVCGNPDIRVLTINHINGGGGTELNKYGNHHLNVLKGNRKVDDLEIRCYNCNILYEYENGNRIPINWEKLLFEVNLEDN